MPQTIPNTIRRMPIPLSRDGEMAASRGFAMPFNIKDGSVVSSLYRRHRAVEFKKFLTKIDKVVPADLDVHLICDNYGTQKTPDIETWLSHHPRFQVHFISTGSLQELGRLRIFAHSRGPNCLALKSPCGGLRLLIAGRIPERFSPPLGSGAGPLPRAARR